MAHTIFPGHGRIAFTGTGEHIVHSSLRRAYNTLDYTPPPLDIWSATLLIDVDLRLHWACSVLASEYEDWGDVADADPERYLNGERKVIEYTPQWHVIEESIGELDWPPLRPEEEVWPELMTRHPVPTGKQREKAETWAPRGRTVEEEHWQEVRQFYFKEGAPLLDLKTRKRKSSRNNICLDPAVRDYTPVARELAEFIDNHKPPKLTPEQRVMERGAYLHWLTQEAENTKISLARLMRNAYTDREGIKRDFAAWSGVSRPTIDAWLANAMDDAAPF